MEKKIGILWVQDEEESYLESLTSGIVKELSLLLPDYEIIFFFAQDVSTAYNLYLSEEKKINFIVTDVKLPEGKKERIEERLHADNGHLWATAVNTHSFGGLNLIKLLAERLRWKKNKTDELFNLPVIYISAWEGLNDHRQILRLYHQSMTFAWIDLAELNLQIFAGQIDNLFKIYRAMLQREAAANTE